MILLETERAKLEDLHREPGKAELIGGRIVRFMATGWRPGEIARNILLLIVAFVKSAGRGTVFGDNVGYAVPQLPSGRESFSPDISYYDGPRPDDEMDFVHGPPTFAVELRSKDGYGPAAEKAMAAKRADYFSAGTKVVWDVDIKAECVNVYTHLSPATKKTFLRGQIADAEPALPGWRVPVDKVFEK